MTRTITLTNSFHNTEAIVKPKKIIRCCYQMTKQAFKRAENKLCGISGCMCGNHTNYNVSFQNENIVQILANV